MAKFFGEHFGKSMVDDLAQRVDKTTLQRCLEAMPFEMLDTQCIDLSDHLASTTLRRLTL